MSKPDTRWAVSDDACGIHTGRKQLEVIGRGDYGGSWSFPVEHTHYTGRHTVKGQRLARRLSAALNAVEKHRAEVEARLDERGHPRTKR
jgi:hypothetical protein